MTPIFLDIVFEIQSMWFFHLRHSSMSTPRNFVNFTISSAVLSSKMFKFSRALVDVIGDVPIIMKFVLDAFTDNLFALNQLVTSSNSLFINSILLMIFYCEYKMVVSSANNINSSTFEVYVILFTCNIKRRGPSIEPCGTPHKIFPGPEVQLLNATYMFCNLGSSVNYSSTIPRSP